MKQKYLGLVFVSIIILFASLVSGSKVFGTSPVRDPVGPQKNSMSCLTSLNINIMEDGKLACYGIWDDGNSFGGDTNLCPENSYGQGTTGCQVKTTACASGVATATKFLSPKTMSLTGSQLGEIAKNLNSDVWTVHALVSGLWEYTCGGVTTPPKPVEETGVYKGYLGGSSTPFITTEKISKVSAIENCKLNSKSNPTQSIYCTWNGNEIYSYTPPTTPVKPVKMMDCANPSTLNQSDGKVACYGVWDYGSEFGNDRDMCQDINFRNTIGCQIQTKACSSGVATVTKYYTPPTMNLNDYTLSVISKNMGSTPDALKKGMAGLWEYTCGTGTTTPPKPVEETGIYKGYLGGSQNPFITTENISKTAAIENCKLNSKSNPTQSIYCTWNGGEIYRYTPPSKPIENTGVLSVSVNGKVVSTGIDMTLEVAYTQCQKTIANYQGTDFRCTWNNREIYSSTTGEKTASYIIIKDGIVTGTKKSITKQAATEDCSVVHSLYPKSSLSCTWDNIEFYSFKGSDVSTCAYGYSYFKSLNTCVKSSYLTYYEVMKRDFNPTISKLSESKLKIVLERIQEIENKFGTDSVTALKIQALKIIIQEEMKKKSEDIFDFSTLFQ